MEVHNVVQQVGPHCVANCASPHTVDASADGPGKTVPLTETKAGSTHKNIGTGSSDFKSVSSTQLKCKN
jgi:hypothetical protein